MSQPADALEREADAFAARVVTDAATGNVPSAEHMVQRARDERALQERVEVQRTATSSSGSAGRLATTPGFGADLASAREAGGEGLPHVARSSMERRFGQDFGDVRIHRDARAAELVRQVRAKAFTVGRDVFFRPGAFDPSTRAGQILLAHELTHVVQQRGGATEGMLQRVPDESGVLASPPRYSFSTHCGWIDWSHATPVLSRAIIDAVQAASDRIRARTGTTQEPEIATPNLAMRSSAPLLGTLSAVTPSVLIKRVLTPSEVLSVALTVYRLTSLGFEMQQQTTEMLGRSSFSQEDLSSNMLGFYRAVLGMDRAGVERACDVWSRERSAQRFDSETFVKNRDFVPPTQPPGGAWPAIFSSIQPAMIDGPLMGVPTAVFESMSSQRRDVGLGFFDTRLSIRPVGMTAPFDISSTRTGASQGPNFEVGPSNLTGSIEYRWSLRDERNNAFSMWGANDDPVHQFSSQRVAYIPSETRAVLRARGVRQGVVLCRIRLSGAGGANETRLLSLPVTFR